MLGWIQVLAHHVQQLVLKALIARELEAAAQVWLEAVALPNAADGRGAQALMLGQRAGAPVGDVDGLVTQRGMHDPRLHLGRERGGATRCAERIDASVQEALAP